MIFKKRFNNNIILANNDSEDIVVMGKGIGFNKQVGDIIDPLEIDQIFVPKGNDLKRFEDLLIDLPEEVLLLTKDIIAMGKQILQQDLNESLLIPLCDHIQFALKRSEEDIEMTSPLQWDMKQLYPQEMEIGQKAVAMIESTMHVKLAKAEQVFIAFHFINAQYEIHDMQLTMQMSKIMKEIINIIQYNYKIELHEDSMSFQRLVTHLRYFILRHEQNEISQPQDTSLFELVKEKYTKAYQCCLTICTFLQQTYQWNIQEDEKLYLILHIQRITNQL